MEIHYTNHATELVTRFKNMLSEDQINIIGEEHFSELETLVTASLAVVYAKSKHDDAKKLESLAHAIRLKSQDIE